MNKSMCWLLLAVPLAEGGEIYKCVGADNISSYTSSPSPGKNCAPVDLKVPEPNPQDVARALENRRQQEEADRAAERDRREQETARAQALAAEAAQRRAEAAEAELRYQRQQPQGGIYLQPYYPVGVLGFPYTQPLPYKPFPYTPFPNRPFPQNPYPGNGPYPAMPNGPDAPPVLQPGGNRGGPGPQPGGLKLH